MSPSARESLRRFLPLLIFLFALGYRLIGVSWGLPNDLRNHSLHPDEPIIMGASQTLEPAKLDFTPGVPGDGFYNYGTLYLTLLRVASDVVAGYTGGPGETIDQYWAYTGKVHLAGRLLNCIFGALTALFVFLIMRRIAGNMAGAWAAAAIAIAPAFVVHSRFQTTDVLATLLLAVSSYFALRLLPREEAEWSKADTMLALWAGVFAGLSAGTKYTGFLALLTVFTACYLSGRRGWAQGVAVSFVASVVAFLVATPGAILDTANFMADFRYEMLHTSTGHGLVFTGTTSGFLYHFTNLLEGLSPIFVLVAVPALGYVLYKRYPWALALAAFFFAYYILIGRAEVLFLRYTFPLYLALACAFGFLFARAVQKQSRLIAVACILALGAALRWGALYTGFMANADPRDGMARYLKAVSQGQSYSAGLVSDPWFYTPSLFKDSAAPRPYLPKARESMAAATEPRVVQYLPQNPAEKHDWDVRLFDLRPEFITFSSFEVGDVSRLSNRSGLELGVQAQVNAFKAFDTRLQEEYELLAPQGSRGKVYEQAGTLVHDLQYIQPVIYIWKRKDLVLPKR